MKFSCDSQTLGSALADVAHAVSSKASLPVLSHLLLEARDNSLTLSATNLEISIQTSLPVDLKEAGSLCLPGRVLLDLVSSLPKGQIEVSEERQSVLIKGDKTSSKVNGLDPKEFPKISLDGEAVFTLNPKEFSQALQTVVFSAAADESRPILTGILLTATETGLTLVGVDGFRLSEKKMPLKVEGRFKQVVPAKALIEAARLLSGEESCEVLLSPTENQIVFRTRRLSLASRLLEGSFPDYQKIIPENVLSKATIDLSEWREALKIVSVFARDGGSLVKIKLDAEKSELKLSATAAEVGENETSVFARIEGDLSSVSELSFNVKYLNDCLNNIEGEEVEFRLTGSLTPGIFVPVGKTDYLHLIMPVRIQS